MKKDSTLVISIISIMLLGIFLIYLGTKGKIWPPTITGIGFIIIARVFLGMRNK